MFLERRHAREILSVQYEMRDAPFQRLLNAGCMLMHQFAQMVQDRLREGLRLRDIGIDARSEEHTSELQSLMRISYAVFCLKKKNIHTPQHPTTHTTPPTPRHHQPHTQTPPTPHIHHNPPQPPHHHSTP